MRRSKRHINHEPPIVNLVPMMDVLLTVLTFFIVVSMTLGAESLIEVQLPAEAEKDAPPAALPANPFIVEMTGEEQFTLNGQSVDMETLKGRVEVYLNQNPDSIVFLLPNQDLPYEEVMQFLGEMRAVGGDRVSLAIEEPPQ